MPVHTLTMFKNKELREIFVAKKGEVINMRTDTIE
jgi:hypothetical protein